MDSYHKTQQALDNLLIDRPKLSKGMDFFELLDDGTKIQVYIQWKNQKLKFDFAGSSSVHPFNLNANPAIVHSVVTYVLRLLIQESIPLNEGLLKAVDINIPQNSFLNPQFWEDPRRNPAVVGGNTETSQRLTNLLLRAFGLIAGSQATMNNIIFGNQAFGYYETLGGGGGAGPTFTGASGVHHHMTNTRITDPEILEYRYPVRLLNFTLRKNSGGKGLFSGGDGLIREYEFLEPVSLSILSQQRNQGPYGLNGGEAGKVGEQYIIFQQGNKRKLKAIDHAELAKGDRLLLLSPGGGAYGKKE
ncbi:MAG: hydantoinase B/oxoprolinase family protein [Bacteroidota bacterium]